MYRRTPTWPDEYSVACFLFAGLLCSKASCINFIFWCPKPFYMAGWAHRCSVCASRSVRAGFSAYPDTSCTSHLVCLCPVFGLVGDVGLLSRGHMDTLKIQHRAYPLPMTSQPPELSMHKIGKNTQNILNIIILNCLNWLFSLLSLILCSHVFSFVHKFMVSNTRIYLLILCEIDEIV